MHKVVIHLTSLHGQNLGSFVVDADYGLPQIGDDVHFSVAHPKPASGGVRVLYRSWGYSADPANANDPDAPLIPSLTLTDKPLGPLQG